MAVSSRNDGREGAASVPTPRTQASISAVAALDDPVRSRLYRHVRSAPRPVTREEAADAVGISRKLAAFHLDKLVAVGLLAVGRRTEQPRRPGRAPKVYEPVEHALSVSVPPRAHDDLAAILIDAISSDQDPQGACWRIATSKGKAVGAAARSNRRYAERAGEPLHGVEFWLADEGYEPYRSEQDAVRLHNCPFHPLAARAPELVCGINVCYLSGVLEGLGAEKITATLTPAAGECCVEVRAQS